MQVESNGVKRKYFIIKKDNTTYFHSDVFGSFKFIKKTVFDSILESGGELSNEIRSNMPGKILKIMVKNGDIVKKGQPIIVIESMKMETKKYSEVDGKVSLFVEENQLIDSDILLVSIEK
jgi:biotin carboxyl carrier protein